MTASKPRVCENCGKPLYGRRSQRYCTPKCRSEAHRTRQTEEVRALVRTLQEGLARLAELVAGDERS